MDNIINTWFNAQIENNQDYSKLVQNPIAYFCAEFALTDHLPIYSGGLGVLAGDMIYESESLGIPMVGIGLLYKKGFFKQTINDENAQEEHEQPINPRTAGLSLLLNSEGTVFMQSIPVKDRRISFQVWQLKVGSVDMYFLDTDVESNTEEDRHITDTLYGGDKTLRLLQEIILGIGGEKTLFAQGIYPSVYHMNEGHSAFAALGIIHHYMNQHKTGFEEAYENMRKKLLFTNHTLVPAGNDVFPKGMVNEYLSEYAKEGNIPLDSMIQKGLMLDNETFSMTIFALHLSFMTNAVSILHAEKAKDIWPDFSLIPITNGVNMQRWINPVIYKRLEEIMLEKDCDLSEAVTFLSKAEIWEMHQKIKESLLQEILNITGAIFDKDIMTVTWARRLAAYKRPDLIFLDIERLRHLLTNIQKPIQVIIAGKPHPKDEEGKAILHNILENIKKLEQPNRIVFIPNYSISLARMLVSGSDLWLNNPIRGYEASGTSGMKAAANGVLQFTIKDGWTDEVDWHGQGWVIEDNDASQSLYWQLENDITTAYYTRDNYLPEAWTDMMIETMSMVTKNYSTKRMVIDYFNKMYIPSLLAQK